VILDEKDKGDGVMYEQTGDLSTGVSAAMTEWTRVQSLQAVLPRYGFSAQNFASHFHDDMPGNFQSYSPRTAILTLVATDFWTSFTAS
jgi:hypothetical protein